MLDILQPITTQVGDIVKVINLSNAPKANTMGQCYIENAQGNFVGMISIHSLDKLN